MWTRPLQVTLDASTSAGTDIHLPVGGSTEVGDIGFIRFTSSDSADVEDQVVDLSGVTLDLNVHVTPDAHFELIFDPTIGDIMAGRGVGDIEMSVSQAGDFRMLGQVELVDGDYLFTLRNVVNKRFEVVPGGRISWYGDPFDATLDVQAMYRVRAPLYDIMFEKNEAYKKRVPVDVVMHLREKLLNLENGFEVRLPSVDDNIRTQVNSVLSTEQELNKQVFALIVLNRLTATELFHRCGFAVVGLQLGRHHGQRIAQQPSEQLAVQAQQFVRPRGELPPRGQHHTGRVRSGHVHPIVQ